MALALTSMPAFAGSVGGASLLALRDGAGDGAGDRADLGEELSNVSAPSVPMPKPSNEQEREAVHVIELGDSAVSENKHTEAIRAYERALGLVSANPQWSAVRADLQRKLSISYERWFRVVGDTEDLRKALVYAQGHLREVPQSDQVVHAAARSRVARLEQELKPQAEPASPVPQPKRAKSKLVGDPQEVITAPPFYDPPKDVMRRHRTLQTGVIVTGSLGWLSLAGLGGSYLMYAKRFDEYFSLHERFKADPDDVSAELVDKARRHRDTWRMATVSTGALTAAAFAAASIMLIVLAKSKKKRRAKKLWAKSGTKWWSLSPSLRPHHRSGGSM